MDGVDLFGQIGRHGVGRLGGQGLAQFGELVVKIRVAAGRFDGVVSLTKDAFTEIAGALVLREAGGVFQSFEGEERVDRDERRFLGGAPWCAARLDEILTRAS